MSGLIVGSVVAGFVVMTLLVVVIIQIEKWERSVGDGQDDE